MSESPQRAPRNSRLIWRWVSVACLFAMVPLLLLGYHGFRQRKLVMELRSRGYEINSTPALDGGWPDWIRDNLADMFIWNVRLSQGWHCEYREDDPQLMAELLSLTYSGSEPVN